ncbi:MAG: hypothetical protein J6Q53_05675 [Oscillospiraceae bacterium]|nr:hypothetical protein [Oscillospiraceae bacterium]
MNKTKLLAGILLTAVLLAAGVGIFMLLTSGMGYIASLFNAENVSSFPPDDSVTIDTELWDDRYYDPTLFYIFEDKTVMGSFYYICYENDNDRIVEVGNKGPFFVWDNRLYFVDSQLYSVDFRGNDRLMMEFPEEEHVAGVNSLYRIENGWIYCSVSRYEEKNTDPYASPGLHVVNKDYKIKIDFTDYTEIKE